MKYKVHWLIDGLVETDANDVETAESVIKNKIESFIHRSRFAVLYWASFVRYSSGI